MRRSAGQENQRAYPLDLHALSSYCERAGVVVEPGYHTGLSTQRRSDEEWIREIERRARAATAGSPGVPWPDAQDQIRSGLSTQRGLSASPRRRSTSSSKRPCGTDPAGQGWSQSSLQRSTASC
jgi:hypothetical protein